MNIRKFTRAVHLLIGIAFFWHSVAVAQPEQRGELRPIQRLPASPFDNEVAPPPGSPTPESFSPPVYKKRRSPVQIAIPEHDPDDPNGIDQKSEAEEEMDSVYGK